MLFCSHVIASHHNSFLLEMIFVKPLEGGPARKLPEQEEPEKDIATVLYIGRVPHGFYEDEMEGVTLHSLVCL